MSPERDRIACRTFFDGLFKAISDFFEPFLDVWQVLKLCRFAVLTIVLIYILLAVVPQGQEVLILLQTLKGGWLSQNIVFLVGVLTWAWAIWYWSRVIVSFRFSQWPPHHLAQEREERILWLHRMTPRALGVIAILVVAVALFWSLEDRKAVVPVLGLGTFYVACAVAFGLVVQKRKDWAARLRRRKSWARRLLLEPVTGPDPRHGALYHSRHELPKPTRRVLWWSFLFLFVIPFLIFQTRSINIDIAPFVGPAFVLLLAAASWVPIGTLLVYWSNHHRVPILTILLAYMALISSCNDNHAVRTIAYDTVGRPTIKEHFRDWVQRLETTSSQSPIPVILIAAEGGGIRAAYWTASVLTRILADQQAFARHVFVISGVSGGSLGAGVFAALLADQGNGGPCGDPETFGHCARNMLREDFLSPTFGTMLYPDLFQRFLFWPVEYWDRGRTLETSWEKVWGKVTGVNEDAGNRFAQPFEELWKAPRFDVPSLIFNTTSVEDGNRVLISNLRIGDTDNAGFCQETLTGRAKGIFDDVLDLHAALNVRPCNGMVESTLPPVTLRLSTAINNSARFSFISPAGTVHERLHIVDGGYFESSGTTTLEEVYRVIRPLLDDLSENRVFVPIVLYISNEPNHIDVGVLYVGTLDAVVNGASVRCIRVEVQGEVLEELREKLGRCHGLEAPAPDKFVIEADESVRDRLRPGQYYTLRLDKDNKAIDVVELDAKMLDEVFTPFSTIFRARVARGTYAFRHLRRQVLGNTPSGFIHFGLRTAEANVPLGWTLSQEATEEMKRQLERKFERCQQSNTHTLIQYLKTCWPKDMMVSR